LVDAPSLPLHLPSLSLYLSSASSRHLLKPETADQNSAGRWRRPCPCRAGRLRLMRIAQRWTASPYRKPVARSQRRCRTDIPISRLGISTICLLIALRHCVAATQPRAAAAIRRNLVCRHILR